MKRLNNLIFVIFASAAFVLSSCDKDVETSPMSVDLTMKAKVTGYVYAETNLTDAGKEPVANVKVILSIPYSKFNSKASGNWIDSVQTDANGMFIKEIPTITSGVDVTVTIPDYVHEQTQPLGSNAQTITKLFTNTQTLSFSSVKPGEEKVKIFEYNNVENFSDFEEFVTITGRVFADLNENIAGNENAPIVDVIFHTYGQTWSKKVTLVKGTNYTTFSVEVPKNQSIYYTYSFIYNKYVYDNNAWKEEPYKYEGDAFVTSTSVNEVNDDITFANSEKILY